MIEKICDTFTATIAVGLRRHYSSEIFPYEKAVEIVRACVDENKFCVSITKTEFYYVDGWEPGILVGFINPPRFATSPQVIKGRAMELARRLLVGLDQHRVSVVFPDYTIMLDAEMELT